MYILCLCVCERTVLVYVVAASAKAVGTDVLGTRSTFQRYVPCTQKHINNAYAIGTYMHIQAVPLPCASIASQLIGNRRVIQTLALCSWHVDRAASASAHESTRC